MLQDLQYAFRNLRRSPLFTLIALLSLALGIGANTALFTVTDQVLLRGLPVAHAGQLVAFTSPGPNVGTVMAENAFSYPMFQDFRDHNTVFENLAGRFPAALNLNYNNRSERIQAEIVTGTYFDTLGLGVAVGRGITPEDDRIAGGHSVVVLTYDFWQSHFGRDAGMLHKIVLLNGHPMTVVGVAARGYRGFDVGSRIDVLVPTMMKAAMTPTLNGLEDRRVLWLQLIGSLRAGVPLEKAQASLQPLYRAMLEMELQSIPSIGKARQAFADRPLLLEPAERGTSDFRTRLAEPLYILLAIVALLLLIACANVANLLLARSIGRQKEIAIRLAVGASRGHLLRQLIVESVLLSVVGGAIGLLFAAWTATGLLGLLANPGGPALTAGFDYRVFAFTFLLSLLTGVLFGAAPAWQATSVSMANALKDHSGTVSGGRGHVGLRKGLVVSQVALSLVMLIAAMLFVRSLRNLQNVDLGFHREGLLTFTTDPSLNGYSAERIRRYAETLQEKLALLPGVRHAAIGQNQVIADNVEMRTIRIEGRTPRDGEDLSPYVDAVSPAYFGTLGIPRLEGRDFTAQDRLGARRVAIVNDVFANYYFPRESAVGKRFAFGRDRAEAVEIVGVVRRSKYSRVEETPSRVIYTPLQQDINPSMLTVYVRTAGDPKPLFGAIRREASQLDGTLPLTGMRTMTEQVAEALAAQRLTATLSTLFAVLATVLAAIGLYGTMAYLVTRRTREFGIRLALGVGHGSLIGMVMREVALLTAAGIAVAVPLAMALTRMIRGQLYGVAPGDPVSIAMAAVGLSAVALLAGYIPAARAARMQAVRALRYE